MNVAAARNQTDSFSVHDSLGWLEIVGRYEQQTVRLV